MRNNEIEYKQLHSLSDLTIIQIKQFHKIVQIIIIR